MPNEVGKSVVGSRKLENRAYQNWTNDDEYHHTMLSNKNRKPSKVRKGRQKLISLRCYRKWKKPILIGRKLNAKKFLSDQAETKSCNYKFVRANVDSGTGPKIQKQEQRRTLQTNTHPSTRRCRTGNGSSWLFSKSSGRVRWYHDNTS